VPRVLDFALQATPVAYDPQKAKPLPALYEDMKLKGQ